jgi:hypothetical protein
LIEKSPYEQGGKDRQAELKKALLHRKLSTSPMEWEGG